MYLFTLCIYCVSSPVHLMNVEWCQASANFEPS